MTHIGVYYSFPAGGIGRYNLEWLRRMGLRPGLNIELACLPEFCWDATINGQHWPYLYRISSPVPTIRRARFLVGQFLNPRRAIRHFAATGCRVLHCTDVNHLSFPTWRGQLDRSGLQFVVTAHDVRRQVAVLNRRYEDRQLRSIYQRADAIFVHARAQAEDLVDFAQVDPQCIHIVPHGPYAYGTPTSPRAEVRARYDIPAEARLGLFFGQLRDEKNLAGLLEAMARGGSQSWLLVAGKAGGHHQSAAVYRALARDLGIAHRVIFDERFIPDREVADLANACDWVALPYRESFTSQSGVLNVAAHYGRPVLSGAAPVLAETVTHHSIGVAAQDDSCDALTTAIHKLEATLAKSDDSAWGFEAYREAHSWERNAEITAKVYDDLL